ncbi:hypothetical protein OPT61_g10039 [Boeremia exigua]|uniref:Uncharacterized protein n=1 Tax=Boeremia exigua TaxID=749465 RepID=A0ACC2HRT9_9PLEO|nr:hypothetical protein OPT61_g10039 [Boeremia exigua]
MDISSPPEPPTTVTPAERDSTYATSSTEIPDSSRLRADSAQEEEARSSQPVQHAQASSHVDSGAQAQPVYAQSFESLVPATTYKLSSTVQVPQSSPTHIPVVKGHGRPSQKHPEPLDPAMPTLGTEQPAPANVKSVKDAGKLRHNLMASPAPASSTGFMYRKVGQPKGGNSNAATTKPRVVSFSSSPTLKRKDSDHAAADTVHAPSTEPERPERATPHASVDVAGESSAKEDNGAVSEPQHDHNTYEQQESYRSRQSQYSTQAAMVLAQLEFQDSSQSSTSSATLRPWSQPPQNTPPPLLPQPSPAITPLSVFNARTDVSFGGLSGESELHGPPASTQDLFDAASPFAFSTVKKKSQRARRTSLRFAMASKLSESVTAKSPTPFAERRPLKEKNTPTTWSLALDKSLYPPQHASQSPKRSSTDVELPQLDFHASLDFGPNTDFTDCFLKGLDNEP